MPTSTPIDPEALLAEALERIADRHGGVIRITFEAFARAIGDEIQDGGGCGEALRCVLVTLAQMLLLGAASGDEITLAGRRMRVALFRWRETEAADPVDIVEIRFGDDDEATGGPSGDQEARS